jgi:tRNA(Ile)-lysidine synthase TilS/MesJ
MKLSGIQTLVAASAAEYGLFGKGCRVVCGLSGGKDSMAMVSLLADMREYFDMEIAAAVYVAGSYDLVCVGLSKEIKDFCLRIGIKTEEVALGGENEKTPLSCYRCSALRRKALLEAAERLSADTVALAHTMDDAAETFLKELLEKGRPEPLAAKRIYFDRISVVRPLIDVPAEAVEAYVRNRSIPVMKNSCPLTETSKRAEIRRLLAECRKCFPEAAEKLAKVAKGSRGNVEG